MTTHQMFLGILVKWVISNWTIVVSVPILGLAMAYLASSHGTGKWRRIGLSIISFLPICKPATALPSMDDDTLDLASSAPTKKDRKAKTTSKKAQRTLSKSKKIVESSISSQHSSSEDNTESNVHADEAAVDDSENDLLMLASIRNAQKPKKVAAVRSKTIEAEILSPTFSKVATVTEESGNSKDDGEWSTVPTKHEEIVASLKNRIQNLIFELEASNQNATDSARKAQEAEARVKDLERRSDDLVRSSRIQTATLEGEISGMRLLIKNLEAKIAGMQDAEAQALNLEKNIQQLQASLQEKDLKLKESSGEIERMQAIVASSEQYKVKYTGLEVQLSKQADRVHALEIQLNEALTASNTMKSDYAKQIETITAELASKQLEYERNSAESHKTVLNELNCKIDSLEGEKASLEQKLSYVQNELSTALQRADELDGLMRQVNQERVQLFEEKENAESALKETNEKLVLSQNALVQLESCLATYNEANESLKSEMAEKVTALETTISKLEAEKAEKIESDSCQKIKDLESVHAALLAEKHGLEEKIGELEAKLEKTLKQTEEESPESSSAANELASLKTTHEAMKKKFVELLHQHSALRSELEEARAAASSTAAPVESTATA